MWFREGQPRGGLFKRFKKSDRGVTAIEFAMVAGPFLYLLGFIFETGIMLFSEYVIENGVAQAARQIRTGEVQTGGTTQAEFKEIVCGKLSSFLHCQDKLYVDIRSFDAFSDIALPDPRNGSDLSDDVTVNAQFSPGNQLCVAVVRTYYEWELFMPGISMLANLGDDRRLLTAGAVFRNEPYGTSGPC